MPTKHHQFWSMGSILWMPLAIFVLSRCQAVRSVGGAAAAPQPAAFLSILRRQRTCSGSNTGIINNRQWLKSSSSADRFQNGFTREKKKHSAFGPHYSSRAYRGGASPIFSLRSTNDDNQSSKDKEKRNSLEGRTGWNQTQSSRDRERMNSLEGRTGWNHNLPSEKSQFWDEASQGKMYSTEDDTSNIQEESMNDSGNENKAPTPTPAVRTGWLHNAEPTPQAKAISQKEQQKTSKARLMLQQAMKERDQNHRMIAPPTFHACGEGRRFVVTEHLLSVPLYRDVPRSPRIDLFFSIVERATDENTAWLQELVSQSPNQRAKAYIKRSGLTSADDMVLYLQGGPGFGSPTPVVSLGLSSGSSWAASALDHYDRVVLMDQRGTGRSTAITKQTLEAKFPELFLLDSLDDSKTKTIEDFASSNPDEVANVQKSVDMTTEYMAQFRADNIVLDAEEIKDALMEPTEEPVAAPRPWGCALGQSFGGFCMMTYLSQVKHPPRICLLTGGIAPMLTPVYDAYKSLWGRVKERSLQYYEQYPGDVIIVKTIVQKLLVEPAKLPSGGTLTARRFLQLGLALGGSPSAFASFHSMLSTAMIHPDGSDSDFTRAFLKYVDSAQSFDDHPIYFWMHESIYGDGPQMNSPTNWAAHRVYKDLCKMDNAYDFQHTSTLMDDDSKPTIFFGEMVFPWMPEDFEEIAGVGLQAVADSLAAKTDWGELYNEDNMRKVLSDGSCKAAAAVYHDDMYVDFDACMKVTTRGGALEKCKVWVTNDYQHSGLRDDGSHIFSKLHAMATGETRTPS